MEILKFIFVLGINFSIFGFIWGFIILAIRLLRSGTNSNTSIDYVLRIVKYFLLVSVTANYIAKFQSGNDPTQISWLHIIVGTLVLFIYLLGKLQNRVVLSQLAANPIMQRFASSIDPKVERFLLLGSIIYFISCLFYPQMVDNTLINWFTNSIQDIYETAIIGWIFSVIAFFFLINTLLRASNVLGRLLSGQSITQSEVKTNFNFKQKNSNPEDGFSEYEDVTDEEEKNNF